MRQIKVRAVALSRLHATEKLREIVAEKHKVFAARPLAERPTTKWLVYTLGLDHVGNTPIRDWIRDEYGSARAFLADFQMNHDLLDEDDLRDGETMLTVNPHASVRLTALGQLVNLIKKHNGDFEAVAAALTRKKNTGKALRQWVLGRAGDRRDASEFLEAVVDEYGLFEWGAG